MNWYKIKECPNYAISEDGQSVKNITTNQLLNHNVAPYAKDGLRRVALRVKTKVFNRIISRQKVYTINYLSKFIKKENKL